MKQKAIQRVIDFTGCNTWQEFEECIRKAMDFPEWYGCNEDALWDLLSEPCNEFITFKGVNSLSDNLTRRLEKYLPIFERNKSWQAQWNRYFDYIIES